MTSSPGLEYTTVEIIDNYMINSHGAKPNMEKNDDDILTAENDIWANSPEWTKSLTTNFFQPNSWRHIVAAIKEGSCVAVTDRSCVLQKWLPRAG